MKKKALITGVTGQDGAYLSEYLIKSGYKVFGAYRRSSTVNDWRLKTLGINDEIEFVEFDLLEFSNILRTIEKIKPDIIFNLAAQSFVSTSFEQPIVTSDINALGTMRILEAIKTLNHKIRFYQASTSEMFGMAQSKIQNEKTSFYPRSPYGISKLFAHWATINYRESYKMFVCSGILFNHESPLRGHEFVTKKIVSSLTNIKFGKQKTLKLGNIYSKRDWGYARDFIEGMFKIATADIADDYVLATGESHTIKEFCDVSAKYLKMDLIWKGEGINTKGINKKDGKTIIEIDKKFYRPSEVDFLIGDASKAKSKLNWVPKTKFKDLIKIMIDYEISLHK